MQKADKKKLYLKSKSMFASFSQAHQTCINLLF